MGIVPGRWLGPQTAAPPAGVQEQPQQEGPPVYGVELTADQWDPLGLHQTMLKVRTGGHLKLTCRSTWALCFR